MLRDCILILIVAFIACLLCVRNSEYFVSVYNELLYPNHHRRVEIVDEKDTLDMFTTSFWAEWKIFLLGITACIASFIIGWSAKQMFKFYIKVKKVNVSLKQKTDITKRLEKLEARIDEIETRLTMKCFASEILYSRDYDGSETSGPQIVGTSQHTPKQNNSINFLDSNENIGSQDKCDTDIAISPEFGSSRDIEESYQKAASVCFQGETEDKLYVKRVQTQLIKPQTSDLSDTNNKKEEQNLNEDNDQKSEESSTVHSVTVLPVREASTGCGELEMPSTEQPQGFDCDSKSCNISTAIHYNVEKPESTCWYSETEQFYEEGFLSLKNMSGDDADFCTEAITGTNYTQEVDLRKCPSSENFASEARSEKPLKTNHSTKMTVVDVCPINPAPDSARSEGWGETLGKPNQRRRIPQFQKSRKDANSEVRSTYEKDYKATRMATPATPEQLSPERYTNPRNSPSKTYRPMSATNEKTETTKGGQRRRRPKTSSAAPNV